jgi:predicted RNA-binding Zn-ribbon protein involved in translation (DUF1610 family)
MEKREAIADDSTSHPSPCFHCGAELRDGTTFDCPNCQVIVANAQRRTTKRFPFSPPLIAGVCCAVLGLVAGPLVFETDSFELDAFRGVAFGFVLAYALVWPVWFVLVKSRPTLPPSTSAALLHEAPPHVRSYLSSPRPFRLPPPRTFLVFEDTLYGADLGDLFYVEGSWYFCTYGSVPANQPWLNQVVGGLILALLKQREQNKAVKALFASTSVHRFVDFGYPPECRCEKRAGSLSLPVPSVTRVDVENSALVLSTERRTYRFEVSDRERMKVLRDLESGTQVALHNSQATGYGLTSKYGPPEVLIFLLGVGALPALGAPPPLDAIAADNDYLSRVWAVFLGLPEASRRAVLSNVPSCGSDAFVSAFASLLDKGGMDKANRGRLFVLSGILLLLIALSYILLSRANDAGVQFIVGIVSLVIIVSFGSVLLGEFKRFLSGRFVRRIFASLRDDS